MPLPIAIAAIVLADLALIVLLTFAMSRAKLLEPHASDAAAESRALAPESRPVRVSARPTPARASTIQVNA